LQNDQIAHTSLEKAIKGEVSIDQEMLRISDILSI